MSPSVLTTRAVGAAPLLVVAPADASAPLPLALWFHGFGADAAANAAELARLAGAGFLAVGVDAAGHGRRRLPDLDARLAAPREAARATMLELAIATADEVPAIVDALVADGLADPARVGAVGVSMGGYLLYQALIVEPRLRAAVALLGSPEWPDGHGPHERPDLLARPALLSVTAARDESVPPDAARRLHQALAAAGAPAQRYMELPGEPHLMGAGAWRTAMDAVVDWLRRYLQP